MCAGPELYIGYCSPCEALKSRMALGGGGGGTISSVCLWNPNTVTCCPPGIGVPIMLAYVYGVVPISLCRSGGCGVSAGNGKGVRIEFDDENDNLGSGAAATGEPSPTSNSRTAGGETSNSAQIPAWLNKDTGPLFTSYLGQHVCEQFAYR